MQFHLQANTKKIIGEITLDGSKSISNRALIIQALCKDKCTISKLSKSDDTVALKKGLKLTGKKIDVGAAGTTMRFLTAFMACKENREVVLTGSERMKQRPIGILVDALKTLGANIEYLENEGYPPMKISGQTLSGGELEIDASVSSQYLSALLMIAPNLEKGLQLKLKGDLVSRPYLEMTLNLMEHFGVKHTWKEDCISIAPQKYKGTKFTVEADWSAASYHYALVALADEADLKLNGLFKDSIQGDSVLAEIMIELGVNTSFSKNSVHLTKIPKTSDTFEYNFIKCPDIAQTLATICAGQKTKGIFSGLQTLAIKETDRTAALQTELKKINTHFIQKGSTWHLERTEDLPDDIPIFDTYHDHRMAMAFAPLSLVLEYGVKINEPMVVTKSYGEFYNDLEQLGIFAAQGAGN